MTEPRLNRRELVGGAAAGAGALALASSPLAGAARRRGVPVARTGSFAEGVASGEPTTDGITLWTRLGGYNRDRKLYLEISSEPDFRKTLYRRNVVARAANDHTVKVRVAGKKFMKPGERYYYRFETRDRESPVGRFKLALPADSREPVRIAFWSCQDFQAGWYGAHRTIADVDDLDLVVCLGDYVYERTFYEGPRKDTLGKNGDGEVQTLTEYRQKYRLYRSDGDLQAMHAAHPFACIWDDHEVEDNYAADKPGEATQDKRVEFLERRANGYRSFFDYMPMRRVRGEGDRLYRALRLGRTAEVFLLDQRQYRDDQPCGDELFVPCPEAENEPRRYLGDAQKEWLKSSLQASDASWKIVGNQLMVMSLDSGPDQPINKDSWDGYGVERREILQHVQDKQIADIAFLTGDIHTFFAGDVGVDGRGPESVATEFVGGSITSLGIPETFQGQGAPLSREQIVAVTQNIRVTNPHLKYDEQLSRGYGLLTASDTELAVEFKAVEARERTTEAKTIGSFRVKRGEPRVETL